jgi:hypothetical protein
MTEKRQTSQGYIIRILQHFATKLRNITNFVMLFQAVMKFLSRSKFCSLGNRSIDIMIYDIIFRGKLRAFIVSKLSSSYQLIRDGPLEKWWGGGEGDISNLYDYFFKIFCLCRLFFFLIIPCSNFFRSLKKRVKKFFPY